VGSVGARSVGGSPCLRRQTVAPSQAMGDLSQSIATCARPVGRERAGSHPRGWRQIQPRLRDRHEDPGLTRGRHSQRTSELNDECAMSVAHLSREGVADQHRLMLLESGGDKDRHV
jgi:hypothetical protein